MVSRLLGWEQHVTTVLLLESAVEAGYQPIQVIVKHATALTLVELDYCAALVLQEEGVCFLELLDEVILL